MSEKLQYLTSAGLAKLKEELEQLINEKRLEISTRLREAILQGDLSENADYIATKEEQGFVEGRIQELDYIISNAKIISDRSGNTDEVSIGSNVTIQEGDFEHEDYHLVGANEANPQEGKISNESPIGKAILGKKKGETVIVKTPAGEISLKIINIA